jgi:hypothetical protein
VFSCVIDPPKDRGDADCAPSFIFRSQPFVEDGILMSNSCEGAVGIEIKRMREGWVKRGAGNLPYF